MNVLIHYLYAHFEICSFLSYGPPFIVFSAQSLYYQTCGAIIYQLHRNIFIKHLLWWVSFSHSYPFVSKYILSIPSYFYIAFIAWLIFGATLFEQLSSCVCIHSVRLKELGTVNNTVLCLYSVDGYWIPLLLHSYCSLFVPLKYSTTTR